MYVDITLRYTIHLLDEQTLTECERKHFVLTLCESSPIIIKCSSVLIHLRVAEIVQNFIFDVSVK